MRCPTLNELPVSLLEKNGWPWTEETPHMPDPMPDGSPWPKISIITPSYNQGEFIEETIRSVLLQGYPNLEYIIIDGGSTDQSVEIIQKYSKYLTYWVSEPDKGQSHAINKGIEKATGKLFTFTNSDDLLAPNVLFRVANYFKQQSFSWVLCGGIRQIDKEGKTIGECNQLPAISWEDLATGQAYQPQPATFWRFQAFSLIGTFREELHYFFDQEFFIRLLMNYKLETMPGLFAYARIHSEAKTQKNTIFPLEERYSIILKFLPKIKGKFFKKLFAYRSISVNYLTLKIMYSEDKAIKKLFFLMINPILFTSPSFVQKILLNLLQSNQK
jgi:glycosyltransferase involved in cell wall biosynthesis